MSVHNPRRYEYRRNLPHFQNGTAAVFVTMATRKKLFLPSSARELILEHILREHKHRARIHCAVVMPDHAHILLSPALDESNSSAFGTAEIMNGIRGASAHSVNKLLARSGPLWEEEFFDRLLRKGEWPKVVDYIARNPVVAGLVQSEDEYPWLWIEPEV
jgi:REP element-mobilizing transposase RayT